MGFETPTRSDMMDELDRDKLSEVGQVTTPTHGAIGLDSNGPWEPDEWFNLMGLGYSDTQAVEAHFKPKIELPGIPFSAVNTSSMVKVVDWGRHGDGQSSAVPPGHELPLTDLLEFGLGSGVGSSSSNSSSSTATTTTTDGCTYTASRISHHHHHHHSNRGHAVPDPRHLIQPVSLLLPLWAELEIKAIKVAPTAKAVVVGR
jgi:hypothetical protein